MAEIRIRSCELTYRREPLRAPFGFKGRYLDELWQTVVKLQSDRYTAVAPCVESVLWSDANVFGDHEPAESSALMMRVTERALQMLQGETFVSPDTVIDAIFPELKRFADKICGRNVAETFVLNALVGVDIALWMLFAKENQITSFDGIIPDYAKECMRSRYTALAHIPLLSYAVSTDEIRHLTETGTAILKIKIGKAVPGVSGHEDDMRSMLEWDIARIREIHAIASAYETPLSKSGKIQYYLDANGRYDTVSRVEQLLDACDRMGALPQIALLEEPLAPENESFVGKLPVCVNADESAHSLADVRKRMELGYKAVALKPIAKTLSVSFRMAAAVADAGGQCLCADLTVNPFLAEWNKQFAARISPLAGMKTGCVEVNGNQNYTNWNIMTGLLPAGLEWHDESDGCFRLNEKDYENSGLLFENNGYSSYFERK